ncbi:MAG: hypothetical protein QM581_05420 [Pseudomonas sp.]
MGKANNPSYRVLLPEWKEGEPWFELTPQQRKTILGGKPHRVAPTDKKQPVHERASTCESLLAVYPNAISVGGVMGSAVDRGDVGFGGIMTVGFSLVLFWTAFAIGLGQWATWLIAIPGGFFFLLVEFI